MSPLLSARSCWPQSKHALVSGPEMCFKFSFMWRPSILNQYLCKSCTSFIVLFHHWNNKQWAADWFGLDGFYLLLDWYSVCWKYWLPGCGWMNGQIVWKSWRCCYPQHPVAVWLVCALSQRMCRLFVERTRQNILGTYLLFTQPHLCFKRRLSEGSESRRRPLLGPLLGPSPGWKRLLPLSHLRHY